jgi:hypothetical protein
MKKIVTTLSLLLATTILSADSANRVEVELTAGVNKFDSSSRLSLDNATMYGLRATMYESVVDKYGFQLAYEGAYGVDYGNLRANDAKESDVHRILANLVIDGDSDYGVVPYVILGGGYEFLSDEIKGEVSQGIADAGIGFRYYLDYGLTVGLEGKVIGKFDSNDLDYLGLFSLGYALNSTRVSNDTPVNAYNKIDQTPREIINDVKVDNIIQKTEVVPTEVHIDTQINEVVIDNTEVVSDEVVDSVTISDEVISDDMYYIQVAAYKSRKTYPTVRKIKDLGLENVSVKQRESAIGTLNVVVVGPYATKDEATHDLVRAKKVDRKSYITKF